MSFKRYQVVSVMVLRGQLSVESFRVRDALANEPILRDLIFATEQDAQEFADNLNAGRVPHQSTMRCRVRRVEYPANCHRDS